MKKAVVLLSVLLMSMVVSNTGSAFAKNDKTDGVYTVLTQGSTDWVNVFTPTQKPWLLIKFDDTLTNPISRWTDPLGDKFKSTELVVSGKNKVWLSFTDDFWPGLGDDKIGKWNIRAFEKLDDGRSLIGTAHFTVIPEPISSTLFLLGGGALAIRVYRKRKQNA